jgi:superfamily I DNA/RNA helicase
VAHLIVLGVDPRRILLLSFSRGASVEMQRRVASRLAIGEAVETVSKTLGITQQTARSQLKRILLSAVRAFFWISGPRLKSEMGHKLTLRRRSIQVCYGVKS